VDDFQDERRLPQLDGGSRRAAQLDQAGEGVTDRRQIGLGQRADPFAQPPRPAQVKVDDETERASIPQAPEGVGPVGRKEGDGAASDRVAPGRGTLLPLAGEVDKELGVGVIVRRGAGGFVQVAVKAQAPDAERPGLEEERLQKKRVVMFHAFRAMSPSILK
jgi:hypothetical protein